MKHIKEIRNMTGLSQVDFAEKYNIPVRTIENWESNVRTPPTYVLDMLHQTVLNSIERFIVEERVVCEKDIPSGPIPGCTYNINVNYDPVRQTNRCPHLQQALSYMRNHPFCLEEHGSEKFVKDYLLFETKDGEIVGEVLAWSTENGIQWN